MAEIVRDLGNRYGDLGSVLARQDGAWFVVSSTTNPDGSRETKAFPANAHAGVTSWREVCGDYGLTVGQVVEALEDVCHCGSPMRGSDHCPHCGCEQYETSLVRDCTVQYDRDYGEDDPRLGSDTPLGEAYGG
jgi:hypothetical protein